MTVSLAIDRAALAALCRRHRIVRLSLFGSALAGTARPDSDVDLLVEFEPEGEPGLLGLAGIAEELSGLLDGRRVDLRTAILEGAVERVRPKMMTVTAIMAGLLPILWSTGTGSEVMQRIAVPMIGGMASSTLLTLLVIPALYALVKGWHLPLAPAVDRGAHA